MTQNSINTDYTVNAAQELLQPSQPAFLAILTSDISNVTGAATEYTVVYQSEIKDVGSDFSSDTFTAPLTGTYSLNYAFGIGDIGAHTSSLIRIRSSNRNYLLDSFNPSTVKSAANTFIQVNSIIADMDAADTATTRITISGSTESIDVLSNGATDPYTWFSGRLEV